MGLGFRVEGQRAITPQIPGTAMTKKSNCGIVKKAMVERTIIVIITITTKLKLTATMLVIVRIPDARVEGELSGVG